MRLSGLPACWLLTAILLGGLCGCATLPAPRPAVPVASDVGRALLDDWLGRRGYCRTLQGVAKVRVQTPQRTLNGTQVLLAEEPDRLRAETLSPFGTPLLVMTANATEFAVLVPGENRFYRGRATAENLERFTRLPLRLADLVSILLARPPLIVYQSLATAQTADGGWLVTIEAGPRRQELHFDAGRRLAEIRYLYGEELQLQLAYGDFDADPQLPPRRIDLDLPQQKTQASLLFKELEINRQFQPELFNQSAPAGAIVTDLDENTSRVSPQTEGR